MPAGTSVRAEEATEKGLRVKVQSSESVLMLSGHSAGEVWGEFADSEGVRDGSGQRFEVLGVGRSFE